MLSSELARIAEESVGEVRLSDGRVLEHLTPFLDRRSSFAEVFLRKCSAHVHIRALITARKLRPSGAMGTKFEFSE